MTALVLYGSNVAASTVATANKLSTGTGGTETTTAVTAPNDANDHEYIEALSQGGTATGQASLPAPTGKGWLLDSTVLEGQTIAAGNWSFIDNFSDSNVKTLDGITFRAYKRSSGGTFTSIGTTSVGSTGTTGSKQQVSSGNSSLSSMAFAVGDKLYIDKWYQGGTLGTGNQWAGDTMTQYESNSGTAGVANDFQVTTPGYSATAGNKLRISDGLGGLFQ